MDHTGALHISEVSNLICGQNLKKNSESRSNITVKLIVTFCKIDMSLLGYHVYIICIYLCICAKHKNIFLTEKIINEISYRFYVVKAKLRYEV